MTTTTAIPARRPKSRGLLAVFYVLWAIVRLPLLLIFVLFILLQIFTPSLRYGPGSAADTYTDESPKEMGQTSGYSGQSWPALKTTLLTNDYRDLKVDYILPAQGAGSGPIPLTVIVAGFLSPEWLLDRIRPRGFNAVVIYRSPRAQRINGPYWPLAEQLQKARKLSDYWNIAATNPLNRLYSIHAGLHEAPDDVVDIITWAEKNISADSRRINIVGLGSGALVAAAAAHKLQASGTPARTLTLVYPPALLSSAIRDNLFSVPRWLRAPVAKGLEWLYFRLSLTRHLPHLPGTAKLLIIPRNSYDLATYAAEPAVTLAGAATTAEYLDVGFSSYSLDVNATRVRDVANRWLVGQGAVNPF